MGVTSILYLLALLIALGLSINSMDRRCITVSALFLFGWLATQVTGNTSSPMWVDPAVSLVMIATITVQLGRTPSERAVNMPYPLWIFIPWFCEVALFCSYPLVTGIVEYVFVQTAFTVEILTVIVVAVRRMRANRRMARTPCP